MSGLPQGWADTTLGAVTDRAQQKIPEDSEAFTYIDIGSVDREAKRIFEPQKILGKDAPSRARQLVKTGDVLVSMTRPNLNAVAMVPASLDGQIASTGFDVLRPDGIEARWLFAAVRTAGFVNAMSDLVQGALYPAIRPRDIRAYEIPLAPLPEQARIADKLDALLARVDVIRARLDTIPALLKRFRQSVLAAATSGALTEEWRGGAEAEWEATNINDAIGDSGVFSDGDWVESKDQDQDGSNRLIQLADVGDGYFVDKSNRFMNDEQFFRLGCTELAEGDVLVARMPAPLGRACLMPRMDQRCATVVDIAVIRPMNDAIVPTWLMHHLNSPQLREEINLQSSGTTRQRISRGNLGRLAILLPPLAEQHEIVRRVESLFAIADRVQAQYTTARAHVDKLSPALLAKAFRGELVPQDPSDEPASALLQRLRAGKAGEPAAKRDRKPATAAAKARSPR